jgi:hypothetical protein
MLQGGGERFGDGRYAKAGHAGLDEIAGRIPRMIHGHDRNSTGRRFQRDQTETFTK